MALPATETFTGAQSALPDPPWTQQRTSGVMAVDGTGRGATDVTDATGGFAFWNADAFSNDHYSQKFLISGLSAGTNFDGVTARASDSGDGAFDNYAFYTDGTTGAGHTELAVWVAGVKTVLRNFTTTFTGTEKIRIEATGSTLDCYRDAASLGTHIDSTFASGSAGLFTQNTAAAGVLFDDWEGGNLEAGSGISRSRKLAVQQRMVA